jgi:TRAP-type C4-dicarboxylate transport system substrate-binding protein
MLWISSDSASRAMQEIMMQSLLRTALATATLLAACSPGLAQNVRWLTQTQQQNAQYPAESAAITAASADGFTVQRNEFQVLGLNLADALRLASSGAFQVVTTQIGTAAKDDAFLEGIDLIGVATDMTELRKAVDAYRPAFNERLQKRFNVKAMAIWPFGPQVFFCNQPIKGLADLKGLKVRSFTASMSTLLTELGASPVTLSFPEVYPALERGVASCGVTSPTSANTGKWPEVTKFLMPLSVSGSVQAHLVNLDWWNGLPPARQAMLEKHFKDLEAALWTLAIKTNDGALACSTGGDCAGGLYTAYKMTLVPISDADNAKVKAISQNKILGEWAGRCKATYPECAAVWNETIGKTLSLKIAN